MFDLTSSKLLILAVVALLVVGPKDFPVLLRTIGRYMGLLRKHATEFRSQFDEAMREAELDQMRAQVEQMSRDIEKSVRDADAKVAAEFAEAGQGAEEALAIPPKRPDRVVIAEPAPSAGAEPAAGSDAAPHPSPMEAAPHTAGVEKASPEVAAATPEQAPVHAPELSPLPRPGALAAETSAAPAPAAAPQPVHGERERSA